MKKNRSEQYLPKTTQGESCLSDNLSELMQLNNVTLTNLHRNTGIAMPTLKRLQSDTCANPTISTLLPIAKFFDVSIEHLMHGSFTEEFIGFIPNKNIWNKVPIIDWEMVIEFDYRDEFTNTRIVLIDIDVSLQSFALIVIDENSLGMNKGSVLIVDPEVSPENFDYVLLIRNGMQKPVIKRIIMDEAKNYFRSLDPSLPLTEQTEFHQILGVVVQIRRNSEV